MAQRQDAPDRSEEPAALFDGAFRLVAVLAAILVLLAIVRVVAGGMGPTGGSQPGAEDEASGGPTSGAPSPISSADVDAFLLTDVQPAADLSLTGPDGLPMSLASLRGVPVLVFFGFTHCADVCPATIGTVGLAIDAYGQGAKAIFVSIDPERDTVPWLAEFVRFMPAGFTAVTGTPIQVRSTADAWGVRYAKVVGDDPVNYEMSHTADVFFVDAEGRLRALFPFGTQAETMTAVMRSVASSEVTATATPSPDATSSPTAVADLWPRVISSSVWAGGSSPVILALYDAGGSRIDDPSLRVTAQRLDESGQRTGPVADAAVVQPVGVPDVSYVPTLDLPVPGTVRLAVDATAPDGTTRSGTVDLHALDPGGTPALGDPAPTVRTPIASRLRGSDLGDDRPAARSCGCPRHRRPTRWQPARPFVLVVDSVRFRVTQVCGRAVVLARHLVDRWQDVPFIHLEPYRYTVVTTEAGPRRFAGRPPPDRSSRGVGRRGGPVGREVDAVDLHRRWPGHHPGEVPGSRRQRGCRRHPVPPRLGVLTGLGERFGPSEACRLVTSRDDAAGP